MAYLHYANLKLHRPDVALRQVVTGLKDITDYLKRSIQYLEQYAVLRVSCRVLPSEELRELDPDERKAGVWVEIDDLDDTSAGEQALKAFLDEHADWVYERMEKPDKQGLSRFDFRKENQLEVIDREPGRQRLCLSRAPQTRELLLRPNTYQLHKQLEAVQALQDAPHPGHRPLLNLFQSQTHVAWRQPEAEWLMEDDWRLLRSQRTGEPLRPGTESQREFVLKALGTRDWGILEGPPGSGKTTTICELILQELRRGHRVLLCASTHVAVDNVIEKLMDPEQPFRSEVIPVRIGDRKNISDTVKPWQIDSLRRTEREALVRWLREQPSRTKAQQTLFEALQRPGNEIIDRIILDSANVVCGTTIGILQHPDIKLGTRRESAGRTPIFDLLIVDEASKTTFQEFLVPALLAQKWILVGDPRQLSPYVEEDHLAANLDAAVPHAAVRDAALDTFEAGSFLRFPREDRGRGAIIVSTQDPITRDAYRIEAERRHVPLIDLEESPGASGWELLLAGVVIGSEEALLRHEALLPLDVAVLHGGGPTLDGLRRRILARREGEDASTWGGEVGWRLTRTYEKRHLVTRQDATADVDLAEALPPDVEALLPSEEALALARIRLKQGQAPLDAVREAIQRLQRVALPSILESLQWGFGRRKGQRDGTALSDGLPEHVLLHRHVLLEFQHRMHPDISWFSRQHIYDDEALLDPDDMAARRQWPDAPWPHRMQWVHVAKSQEGPRNEHEVKAVERELKRFLEWARTHSPPSGRPWEVAVLTFYRAQERLLRAMLRRITGQPKGFQRFSFKGPGRGAGHPTLIADLCTVDRFQGHEADLVLLSFGRTKGVGFLDSPNRLNVALTRARYQTLLVGNRQNFEKQSRSELLRHLAALKSTHDLQE